MSVERTWKGVFDVNYLFDDYKKLISSAKNFIYVEHQYPFQNYALTYFLCQALQSNVKLKVIIYGLL